MKRLQAERAVRAEWLRHCGLFGELGAEDLSAIAEVAGLRSYAAGEALFHDGTPAEGFHVVVDGLVKVFRVGGEGREQVLHLFGRGEPCGEVAMFQGGTFPASAMAMADSRTLYLARQDFLDAARQRPELLLNMLGLLSRRLRRFVDLIDDLSLKEVSARLALRLLELAGEPGPDGGAVSLEVSKATLAAQIGTVPETLSRTLARMQQRGILEVTGRAVLIKNLGALRAIAGGEKV
ncbi:MAG: Crp/Fnr family transcriptional regulator [Candidatus Hydrogenedens sp.]|nr:Crp/Fnr family transcriptional regulator [Candidatus Hydrogenedentota bacterium]NLF58306.1 Crp/Fnr family transcriptional regulator [Candidatus Hydrogenedens sp.]